MGTSTTMSVLEWKNVTLFDLYTFSSTKLHQTATEYTTCCCNVFKCATGKLGVAVALCEKNGYIQVIFENGIKAKQISFKCSNGDEIIKFCTLTTTNLLTLLSQNGNSVSVHIYDLKTVRKESLHCSSTSVLSSTSTATCLQVSAMGHEIIALGIGFENGDLLLYIGNFNSDLCSNIRRYSLTLSTIKGIQFRTSPNTTCDKGNYEVYVMCVDGVYCLAMNDKISIEARIVIDMDKKMYNECFTLSKNTSTYSFLAVGRKDAIICFRRDNRGPRYIIEGPKQFLSWVDKYLLVAVKTNFGTMITIIDVDINLIILHRQVSNVIDVVNFNKSFYVITEATKNGESNLNVYMLKEQNANKRTRTLFSKCMYENAIIMLKREEHFEHESEARIRFKHGRSLMSKGSIADAVYQYLQTIGVLKSYDVITQLIHSKYNINLMEYIKKCLKTQFASVKHQKLLIICKNRQNLDHTINQLWMLRNDTNQICDIKNIPTNDISLGDLQKFKENEIINFFSIFGQELLLKESSLLLNTFKTLIIEKVIKNIVPFLIFPDYKDFNAKLLSFFIEINSSIDEKLHHFLLSTYLALWNDSRIDSGFIESFLKKSPIRVGRKLILSKAYLYSTEIEYFEPSEIPLTNAEDDAIFFEFVRNQVKTNPILGSMLKMETLSLLTQLKNLCSTEDIQVKNIRTYFTKKFKKNGAESKHDEKLVEDIKYEIAMNGSLLQHHKLSAIEFRNNNCFICYKPLSLPCVHYLCQHSFHKDCLRFNFQKKIGKDVGCALCDSDTKYFAIDVQKSDFNMNLEIINGISYILSTGMDQRPLPRLSSKNPFDEHVDSNFNMS